ncbi:MAG: hypothetical protein ACSHXW_15715 [Yoonia sp.]
MTQRSVIHGNRTYEVTPDFEARDRVFVIGSLTDDADGRAIARQAMMAANETIVFTASSERAVALAGNPHLAFADRGIAHDVSVTFRAEGYRDATHDITIPAMQSFPMRQDFTMRRRPIVLQGRVFGRVAGPPPADLHLPGATISLEPVADGAGNFPLLLRQALRADQAPGATLRRRAIAAASALHVIGPAARGQRFVGVVDGTAVGPGQVLRFGPEERPNYAEVVAVLAHPDFPAPAALLELTEPLLTTLRAGTALARFILGGFSGPSSTLAGQSFAGEAVLALSVLPSAGGVLVLREAGQPDRYHDADAICGDAGDYLIAGLARVGAPSFVMSAAGFATQTRAFPLDRLGQSPLNWVLSP